MRKRVPLNAIRAFEATARNGSVAKAADELCVTPTAVSHQIRLLEDFLQTRLFNRKNSRIELTPESSATVANITSALDLINDAVLTLQAQEEARTKLSVAASASVASLWLMPRLSEFFKLEPEVDVNVRAFMNRREGETLEAELRICNWRSHLDMQVEPLLEEEIIPVATPELAAQYGNDAKEILAHAPLIHVDRMQDGLEGTYPDWARYLREYGVSRDDVTHGPRFNQASPSIEAARSSFGVILGRSILIERAMERGELVAVGESYPIRSPYYLLSPWKADRARVINRFKDWLFDKVGPAARVHPT
ncbi:LysR family transcriptional regulator [Pseudooceanicola nanhaiensis]|jgi:LysR family glycine cleavage system transcriptional activator|uniref:LysR family transcriptional regulator n=1 Tax=Pseudooceanicola nanhaiensis TaxID=375761 RepID=A0A917SHU0_9RHOB|nr:LysR family transcriptional regulator [Pseudooceanicola nanhaiensis]GGL82558.1 LysR family transcriptional regulator [Pseudooceanicola nanhaiensis]